MGQEIGKTDLAELRRLHEAATPGEWALAWEDGKTGVLASMIGKLVALIGNRDSSDGYEPTRKANGELIAAAHNALPALLDELEAARLEMRRQGSVIAEAREEVRRLTQANGDLRKERDRAVAEAQRQDRVAKGLRAQLAAAEERANLGVQALAALAWMSKQSMPLEIALKRWRILGRDPRGHLRYYYADTPLGAILAAMEGERDGHD